jgi:L,D-transpeptidase-like protein
MKRPNFVVCVLALALVLVSCGIFINKKTESSAPQVQQTPTPIFASAPVYVSPFANRSVLAKSFAAQNGYSTSYCFFIDMSIHSGRKRFFVYDLTKNVILISGLVAHGSCKEGFLTDAKFSNLPGCGCSSLGKYKIGEKYRGQYGTSYKLYGLDNTNSNAYRRAVVLHGLGSIPDEEIYPKPVCNSFGCPMVSTLFFTRLAYIIDKSDKPIILWIYN